MTLDFLVIGAQKGGTTSLWQYLRAHPRLCLPKSKEVPAFTAKSCDADKLDWYMSQLFEDAPDDALFGKVTPDYMVGQPGVPVATVAERIASVLPQVRLIAILRDPICRAVSSYMMAVRREQETRPIDVALAESLEADALRAGRDLPTPINTYVTAGEYGRMLGSYRRHFAAEQIEIVYTKDLSDDPGRVLDRILAHLGLPEGFRPEGLDARHFRGGTRKLLDAESELALKRFYADEVLPNMKGSYTLNSRTFAFFFETWNVAPNERHPRIAARTRSLLQEHFDRDGEELKLLGIEAPWLEEWNAQADVSL